MTISPQLFRDLEVHPGGLCPSRFCRALGLYRSLTRASGASGVATDYELGLTQTVITMMVKAKRDLVI